MGSEGALWKRLHTLFMDNNVWGIRVENSVYPGTPDVYFCALCEYSDSSGPATYATGGWMELKQLDGWGTQLTDLGIRETQRNWWRQYARFGGHGFLLAQIGNEYLLFWGNDVPLIYGKKDHGFLTQTAYKRWEKKLNGPSFVKAIV